MIVSLGIAKRYFFSRKSGGAFNLISIISGISLLGYFIGAAALVVVLSVFNGFENMFQGMYNRFDPQVKIAPASGKVFEPDAIIKQLEKIDGIETFSLVLEENVLLKYADRQNIATIKGVDEQYLNMTDLDSCMVAGDLLLQSNDVSYALLGQGVAWQLGADPQDIFQQMVVYVPKRGETDVLNPEGSFTKTPVRLAGVFSVQEEIDNKVVLVPLQFLRPLLERQTAVSAIEIRLKLKASDDKVVQAIKSVAGTELKVLGRYEQREGFYKVLKSEKLMSYIILFFILLIASTNAIGSLYILVMEKKKDIKMLSALGLTNSQIASVYNWNSLFIAITGGGLGMLAGIFITKIQEVYGFVKLSRSADFISIAYPVQLRPADLLLVAATIVAIGFLAAIYPAAKARQMAQVNQ